MEPVNDHETNGIGVESDKDKANGTKANGHKVEAKDKEDAMIDEEGDGKQRPEVPKEDAGNQAAEVGNET